MTPDGNANCWHTGCSVIGSPAHVGSDWPISGRTCSVPYGPPHRTKNPACPPTLYVDGLIGRASVNTLPEVTIAAFEAHGTPARTIDRGVDEAAMVMRRLAEVGVDMDSVGLHLERAGVASFHASYQEVLAALTAKAGHLQR